MSAIAPARFPVFIVGVMNRCGTNYLSHVLRLHPVFKLPGRIVEDYALQHSDLLIKYVERTTRGWSAAGNGNACDYSAGLLSHVGDGIVGFLADQIDSRHRILAKTPRPHNLGNFFRLFPQAKLLILVRDGRDVVESAGRSWKYAPHAYWMSQWAAGARAILEFVEGAGNGQRNRTWKLVRYEDLVENTEAVVRDLLDFVEADPAEFDWSRIGAIPLRGSSTHRGDRDRLHWEAVPKPQNFQPVGRWGRWGWPRRRLLKAIAGRELIRLGYVANNRW